MRRIRSDRISEGCIEHKYIYLRQAPLCHIGIYYTPTNLHKLELEHAIPILAHKLRTSWTLCRLHDGCVDLLPLCSPLSLDDSEAGRSLKTTPCEVLVIKIENKMAGSQFQEIMSRVGAEAFRGKTQFWGVRDQG